MILTVTDSCNFPALLGGLRHASPLPCDGSGDPFPPKALQRYCKRNELASFSSSQRARAVRSPATPSAPLEFLPKHLGRG